MKHRHNKNHPTDRGQIDPRVVIGTALSTSYKPVAGSPEFATLELARTESPDWQGIHGGVPL